MPLPSSPNTLHFGGLADNNESASKDSISMRAYSRIFASGSEVGNVDGSGDADTTADRNKLNSAPYAMSEFYDAHIPNALFGSVVAKLTDDTDVSSNGYVDGEAGRIYWTITEDPEGSTTYTGGLKYKSDASVAASSTLAFDGTGTKYVTITAPSTTEQVGSPYRYYSFVSSDLFKNAVGADLSHYDQLSGGSVNSTTTSFTIDASSETNQFLIRPVVSVGTQGSYSTSTSQVTAGDNRGISIGSSGGSPASSSVTMTGAGVTQIGVTHIGSPTQARNNTTSTENITVAYNQAIESLTLATSATVNYGANNLTVTAISEGVNGVNLYVGYDDNNTAGDTTFTWSYDNVTSLYVRTLVSKTFTAPAGSYYIKAKHTGDGNAVVGASFIVAPTFVYTTIGNSADISVNGTSHTFRVTSSTGNNIVITISNNLNATTTTDYGTGFSLSPGTADGIYTVTYTGTANYSQTNNQTDIVNCYPDANYTINSGDTTLLINSPVGSGLTDDNLQLNATTSVGDNISAYYYVVTKDTAFLDSSLNKTYTDAITTIAASTLESAWGPGTYNTSLRVTGGGSLQNTQTDNDSFTIADHPPQTLTVTAPNGNILRRGSAFSILWSKQSAVYVNLHLYRDVLLNGSYTFDSNIDVAGNNTGTSYSWTVPGDQTLVDNRYKVYGFVYNGTATDFSPIFSIRDGVATSPTNLSTTAGNGSATISWTDGSYNGGGNKVYIYDSGQSQIATSTQSGTSYAYPYDSNNKYTVYFKVSGINLSSEEGSLSGFSSAVIIYPDLTGHNDIVCSGTVYSTTNNSTGTTKTISVTDTTNNVTSYTYSVTSGGGSISSGATGGSTINDATYQAAAAGSVVLRLTVNGDLSQTGDYTEATITSILYPKVYNATTGVGGGTVYKNGNFYVYWQGFTLNADTDSITFKLYNSSNVQQGSTLTKLGNESEFVSAGSTTATGYYYKSSFGSVNTNHGVTSAGDYYYIVEAFDEGVSKGTYTTSTFSVSAPTNISINCETEEGSFVGGYSSLINAADTTPDFVNGTKSVWYSGGSLSNGTDFYTENTLTTIFDGDPNNNDTAIFYSYGGDTFEVEDDGCIAQLRSRTPNTLATPTLSVDGETDIDLTVPSSNTIVARSIRVHSSVAINSKTTETWTVTQSAGYTATKSMAAIFGADLAAGTPYTFKIQGFNNDGYTGTYSSTATATTDSVADPVWGSQPSIGTIGGLENQTRYRPISNPSSFTIGITNADTDANQVTATISNIQGSHQFTELSCIVSTGTIANGASWPGEGVTSATTAGGSTDTIHFRFRIASNRDAPQGSQSGTLTFTLSNGGVDSTFTNVAWEVGE